MNALIRTGAVTLLSITGLIASSVFAQAVVEPEILANPDPILAERYREGTEEIERLRAVALDTSKASEERLGALQELADKYPDAILSPSAMLVSDPDTAVAEFAANQLASAIVMSDHPMSYEHSEDIPPFLQLMYWRHQIGREGLRRAITDSRSSVRDIAASSLATLSDPVALEKIEAGVASGIYSDTEAANYFGLADPEVGAPLMQELLAGGSPSAQASAVSYLGSNPTYQGLVRDKYLFNSEVPEDVRAAAAATLGQYDPNFPSYATTLTADPTLPASVYTRVLEGYINQSGGDLQPAEASALKAAIDNYIEAQPDADLSGIIEQLNSLTTQ